MTDFIATTWWLKYYSLVIVTSDGVYADGEVSPSYSGTELKMEMVHVIVSATKAGHLTKVLYSDFGDVKDQEDKTGLGLRWKKSPLLAVERVDQPAGPSAVIVDVEFKENPMLNDVRNRLIEIVKSLNLANPFSL